MNEPEDPITARTERLALLWLAGKLPPSSWRTQAELWTVLATAEENRRQGGVATVRGLYYEHSVLFRHSQANAARAIATTCRQLSSSSASARAPLGLPGAALSRSSSSHHLADTSEPQLRWNVTREQLGFRASPKGFVVGPLAFSVTYADDGGATENIDVASAGATGALLPTGHAVLGGFSLRGTAAAPAATWVLVVEKEATAATLASSPLFPRLGCVMVCGRGYPCVATRRFLHALHGALPQLPVGALVDCDPHGVQILLTYAFGGSGGHSADAAPLPNIQWLGLLPSVARAHATANELAWTTGDGVMTGKLVARLKREASAAKASHALALARKLDGWAAEVKTMQSGRVKAELQSLQADSPHGTAAHVLDLAEALGFIPPSTA